MNQTPDQIISQVRQEQRMSLRDFGAALGVSHNSIAQYENGIAVPDIDRAVEWLGDERQWVREMATAILYHRLGPTFEAMVKKFQAKPIAS